MKKFIKFAILLVALGLSTTSCEDWLDVNTDPNNPTEVMATVPPVTHMTTPRSWDSDAPGPFACDEGK